MKKIIRIPYILFLFIIFQTIYFPHAQAENTVIPTPEDYLPRGQLSEYIQDAQAYLSRNPASNFAPRIALDILMVANRIGNKSLADSMKVFLLFEHSHSLQGIHILTTFKDATEFRDFILEHAESQLAKKPLLFPHQFTQIIDTGLFYYKNKLLDDGNFLLIAYCLANAAGENKTVEILLPALRKISQNDASLSALLDICLDKRTTASEKIIKLHEQEDSTLLESFYLSTLSQSEKKQPAISRILISNAIKAKDYKSAQLQLDAMPENFKNDPQILFWQGWIQYSLYKDRQALDTLSILNKTHPNSGYANTSRIYMEGIRNFERYREIIVHEIFSALEVLRSGIGILQANVKFVTNPSGDREQEYLIYIGLLPKNNFLELLLYRDNEMVLGYRTSYIDSAIYLLGHKKILTFNEPAAIPVPSLLLQREDNDNFTLNAGFEFSSSIKDAGVKTSSLFDSPYLSTIDGINDLIGHIARRHGWVPINPVTKNGATTFRWRAPSIDSPDLIDTEYNISENAIVKHFKYGNLRIDDLRYSKEPSFQLTPPPWPQYPVAKSDTFDFSILMQFMGAVMQLLGGGN